MFVFFDKRNYPVTVQISLFLLYPVGSRCCFSVVTIHYQHPYNVVSTSKRHRVLTGSCYWIEIFPLDVHIWFILWFWILSNVKTNQIHTSTSMFQVFLERWYSLLVPLEHDVVSTSLQRYDDVVWTLKWRRVRCVQRLVGTRIEEIWGKPLQSTFENNHFIWQVFFCYLL